MKADQLTANVGFRNECVAVKKVDLSAKVEAATHHLGGHVAADFVQSNSRHCIASSVKGRCCRC
jgi:hypothetical protein